MRWALLLFSVVLLAGVAASEERSDTEQIGPYELEQLPEGLEIRSQTSAGLRGVLLVAAGLCFVAAIPLTAVASGPAGAVLAGVALALALTAAAVRPGPDRARVSQTNLWVEGLVGRQGTTPADSIDRIEVQRRTPSGAESKRSPRPRAWQVTVRGREDNESVVRFRVATREDATALAQRIGAVLDRPVVQRRGRAR